MNFCVAMKISRESNLNKIVERYRVANDPDLYVEGGGEKNHSISLYPHAKVIPTQHSFLHHTEINKSRCKY